MPQPSVAGSGSTSIPAISARAAATALHRMVGGDVAGQRRADVARYRQEPGVLAGAVVVRRLGARPAAIRRSAEGPWLGGCEPHSSAPVEAEAGEPGAHQLDVRRLAAMRGAGERSSAWLTPNSCAAPLSSRTSACSGLTAERANTGIPLAAAAWRSVPPASATAQLTWMRADALAPAREDSNRSWVRIGRAHNGKFSRAGQTWTARMAPAASRPEHPTMRALGGRNRNGETECTGEHGSASPP